MIEDISLFFDEMATTATSEDNGEIVGIFDYAYEEALGDIEGRTATFLCSRANADLVAKGETLTIDALDFLVVRKRPIDDGSLVYLDLEDLQ